MKNCYYAISLFVLIGQLVITSCSKEDQKDTNPSDTIPISEISLEPSSLCLEVGQSETIYAIVMPSNASTNGIIWSSDNNKVASVDNGLVTAHSIGCAHIIASIEDGSKTASCSITVVEEFIPVSSVSIDPSAAEMVVGGTMNIVVTVAPSNATDRAFLLSSSNEDIVKISSDNELWALSVGTAVITVKAGNKTAQSHITVKEGNPISSLECAPNEILYVTKYGTTIKLGNEQGFGGNFVSDSYENGIGRLVFGNDITAIPENGFAECNSIEYIKLPEGVRQIGKNAFLNCSSLKEIDIPNNVTKIGAYCFEKCTALERIYFPKMNTYGKQIFKNCKGKLFFDGYIPSFDNNGETFGLFIGSKFSDIVFSSSITRVPRYSCYNCSSIQSISFNGDISSIGYAAFMGCKSLASIIIPNSLTSLDSYAFMDCSSLTSISIPEGVQEIKSCSFKGCSSLARIELPNSVTNIGSSAFYGCSSLADFVFPSSIIIIGDLAFSNCTALSSIIIPEGAETIGHQAFSFCTSLSVLKTPRSIKTIGYCVAEGCSGEWTVYPNEGLETTAPEKGFVGVMIIPDDVESLPEGIFRYTLNMKGFKGKFATSDGRFLICNKTLIACLYTNVSSFPQAEIKRIGANVFETLIFDGKFIIRQIPTLIPEGVEEIGREAFYYCMTPDYRLSIVFPASLRLIEDRAFIQADYRLVFNSFPKMGKDVFWSQNRVSVHPGLYYKWKEEAQVDVGINGQVVDLGLKVKWSATNLEPSSQTASRANRPEYIGYYYAWGEVSSKNSFSWSNYKWGAGPNSLTKYNTESNRGIVDNIIELKLEDDAAHVILGDKWRIPNDNDWAELINNCRWTWTTLSGRSGFLVESKTNMYSIFLPSTGYYDGDKLCSLGTHDYYWSSSLSSVSCDGRRVYFNNCGVSLGSSYRYYGKAIRPVTE